MEAGVGDHHTLKDRLAARVFYSDQHSQGHHTPSDRGRHTRRPRALPRSHSPPVTRPRLHQPPPRTRPGRAPRRLPPRSDPRPPATDLSRPAGPVVPASVSPSRTPLAERLVAIREKIAP